MKLMITIALSHHARLLVFDEPTSGLDPVARDELSEILGDFLTDERHSILFSTHITSDLERIGDYLTLIHDGRIVGHRDQGRDPGRATASCAAARTTSADVVGIPLIGLRRTGVGVQALVAAEEAELLGDRVVIDPPNLEEIAVHIGSSEHDAAFTVREYS